MTDERLDSDFLGLDELLFLILDDKGLPDWDLNGPTWIFNEAEIARALDEMRERRARFKPNDGLFIESLAKAFRGQDTQWKISVTRRGKAPVVSIQHRLSRFVRDGGISLYIASRLNEGIKLEAAIAEASENSGLKRAALFKIWRANRDRSIDYFKTYDERGRPGKLWAWCLRVIGRV